MVKKMIKLERSFTPLCLRPSEAQRLTNEYKSTGHAVWNFEGLKLALLETSHNKCAYCECDLSKESKYMEVEHFLDKNRNPDYVVSWSNLLPSCKRCNGAKGTHDVSIEAIVNPYEVNPKDHFIFRLYRLKAKSTLGESTIGVLDLNNSERVVKVRFEIGEAIQSSVQIGVEKFDKYKMSPTTRNKNGLLAHIEGLLFECQTPASYAAISATVLHNDDNYQNLKNEMEFLGLWGNELDRLHSASFGHALEPA
jgi:uncharacterized protein (TIGR02646 family)